MLECSGTFWNNLETVEAVLTHSDNTMNIDNKNVTIVVLDGIVMGPTVNIFNIIIYIINTNLVFIALCY